jgi:respiratory burst oxidase
MGTNEIEVVSSELIERVHHNNGSVNRRKTKSNSVISPELEQDNEDEDFNEATLVLQVQGDTMTLESVKPVTDHEENIKLEKKISFGASVMKTALHLKQVSGEMKRLATSSTKVKKYDRTESAAFHALKKFKFITVTKTDGDGDNNGWLEVERRFDVITKKTNGLLHRSQFSKCIGIDCLIEIHFLMFVQSVSK